jgi:serine/threonine protein kinase
VPHPLSIGRYKVLGLLGKGAMGIVYRGRDEGLERDVAIKVMAVPDSDGRSRFLKEARAAARLQHPNIITIYELGEHEGAPFMALELLEGCDLQHAIEEGIRPDPALTLPVVIQVLAGLGNAHDQGIVHRDIKPSNVFLCKGRPAKIMDFGVARLGKGTTTAGAIVGTPYYMSPEQVLGGPIDGRSDLFSVGLILYELVTGEKGYRADSVVSLLYKIAHEAPDVSLIPKDSRWEGIRSVLHDALARDPKDRYPDAQTMERNLREALRAFGGSESAPTAADSGLLIPASSRTGAPPREKDKEEEVSPGTPKRRGYLSLWIAGGIVALGFFMALLRRPSAREGSPAPPSPPLAASSSAPQTQPPSLSPARRPSPLVSVAPPAQGPSPAAPQEPSLSPSQLPTLPPTQAPPVGSLERAQNLFERGELQGALLEAKAFLAQSPNDREGKALAQRVEASLVVEQRIRSAREALRRGDKEAALEEIRLGFAVNPKDQRLLDLFREATQ